MMAKVDTIHEETKDTKDRFELTFTVFFVIFVSSWFLGLYQSIAEDRIRQEEIFF